VKILNNQKFSLFEHYTLQTYTDTLQHTAVKFFGNVAILLVPQQFTEEFLKITNETNIFLLFNITGRLGKP
jgi:hypothetical protein